MVLALIMIPALLVPEIFTLAPRENAILEWASWAIYAFFAGDLLIKLYLAPNALQHLRSHWLDLLVVLLPLLRPLRVLSGLRILQLLRALPVVVFAATGLRRLRMLFVRRNLDLVLLLAGALVLVCATLVYGFERNTGSAIDSFGDALWWAVATVTTVGYGDTVPATAEARIVAFVLASLRRISPPSSWRPTRPAPTRRCNAGSI
jgi:voltage-gated potassium channel